MLPPPKPTQAHLIWLALTALAVAVLVALLGGIVWSIGQVLRILSPVLWPLAVAGVLAYLLDPVVDFFQRRKVPRPRAILMVFASALLLVAGAMGSLAPRVVTEARDFGERLPNYSRRVQTQLATWSTNPPVLLRKIATLRESFLPARQEPPEAATTNDVSHVASAGARSSIDPGTMKSAADWVANLLPKFGSWLLDQVGRVTGWFGVLAGLFLVPVYAFYFLLEKRGIESRWTEYLPVRNSWFKDELVFVLRAVNDYLIVFFRSQVLVAICDGILYTLGFLIIGLPYALLIGIMATALTMIPFVGAIFTCVTALVIAFATTGGWQLPALVLAVVAVVQAAEGLFISPKIMGDRVGLHPLTIIIAVMVGTTLLGGILGGVLAIPLTAALRVLMFRYVWKKRGSEPA
jgi:predicted PurR-regulated permease PerM